MRKESQVTLGTFVGVVAFGAALKAGNLLNRFRRQPGRWTHARHHETARTHCTKVLAWSNSRVHLLLHVLLSLVRLSHIWWNLLAEGRLVTDLSAEMAGGRSFHQLVLGNLGRRW